MSCRKIERLIQACVDGAATRPEREAVDAHVAECAACRQTLKASRDLVLALSSAPRREVSDSFERNLAAALRHTAPVSQSSAWWQRFRLHFEWRLRVPAMAAACGLAAGVLAAVVVPQVEQHQETQRNLTAVVQRHKQLQHADTRVTAEALEASIDLSTGHGLTD